MKEKDTISTANAVLTAGIAEADITPPLQVGLLTSSVKGLWQPFESVRMPLRARVVVLASGETKIAIVSLDLLGLTDIAVGGWDGFKQRLAGGVPAEQIIITCTHTHNAPESLALTCLFQTAPFKKWLQALEHSVASAIRVAASNCIPVSISSGLTGLEDFSLQRRVPSPGGILMSDGLQPISPELMDRGPVDRRVNAIRLFAMDGPVLATLVHAVCHPVHEMCLLQVSPDFPGELCAALSSHPGNGMPLFLNGAAGDINPPTVSWGAQYAQEHGAAMARAAESTLQRASMVETAPIIFSHRDILLPARKLADFPESEACMARLKAICVGSLAIIFLPGEVFVETGRAIEIASPFPRTLVVGFSENSVGYIPPKKAFEEGGYETGPGKWSFLQPGADELICRHAVELLHELKQKRKQTATRPYSFMKK